MIPQKYSYRAKSFSEIKIGDKINFDVVINENMHNSFTNLFSDNSPVHCDPEFCVKTKFRKKIGYAYMLTGFLSRLYGEYLPGGTSICIKQEAKFIKPYFIGDKITIYSEVISKIDSTKFVEIKTEMFRNDNECIFKGSGIVQVIFEKKQLVPLYKINNKFIYYSDFIDALKKVGINNGDIVFVHSDIATFGKLGTTDKDFLLKTIINSIKEVIGNEGTILMPAFSYSFCNKEVYDLYNTKSSVGILTEYFRKLENVKRTVHPIFSTAIWGKNQNEFLDISKDSFDDKSIFGKLHKKNGKLLFLGAPFQSCTFIHYIEQMYKVPYRHLKSFKGKIKIKDKAYKDEFTFFVRDLKKDINLDGSKIEKHLLKKKIMKKLKLGNGRILLIETDDLYKEGINLLNKDIFFFLKESTNEK